jgi:hypothetical protein
MSSRAKEGKRQLDGRDLAAQQDGSWICFMNPLRSSAVTMRSEGPPPLAWLVFSLWFLPRECNQGAHPARLDIFSDVKQSSLLVSAATKFNAVEFFFVASRVPRGS